VQEQIGMPLVLKNLEETLSFVLDQARWKWIGNDIVQFLVSLMG